MPTKQRDILNTQNNVDETHNSQSSNLIEHEKMKDTPFTIIGNAEKGYMGTLGKYQITEYYPTKQAVEDYIEGRIWEVIIKVAGIVAVDLIDAHDQAKNKQITKI